jgi:hypothetical protein
VKPSECPLSDRDDVTKLRCYCHFHTDPLCFNAAGEGQADKGGDTGGTITADNTCVDTTDPTCSKQPPVRTDGSVDTSIRMRDTRDGGAVNDNVNVTISAGRCGEVVFVREATLVPGAAVDIAAVSTYFRLILESLIEFGDANNNGELDDGDDIRTKLDLSSLTCAIKRSSVTFNGAECFTITVYDLTGVITFTFTICSSSLTIGSRSIPARSAFEILEIHWQYSASDSKLALFFDAYSRNIGDVFTWDAATSSLILNNGNGFNKGSLTFDLNARSGDNDAIPLKYKLSNVLVSSVTPIAGESKVYRLIVSVDAFSPYPLIIDPVYSAGNQPSTVTASTSEASHAVAAVYAAVFVILASIVL